MSGGFMPPEYPYERLGRLRELAGKYQGGAVDLSVGSPCDPPPDSVVVALSRPEGLNGYPPSRGSEDLRGAGRRWMEINFGVSLSADELAACIGTKELVASLPHLLRLRTPERDIVLHPEPCYPTYAMGAVLAGCTPIPVRLGSDGRMDLASVDPEHVDRALVLWVNSPNNPTGRLEDLRASAQWGRNRGILVASDECYAPFTWSGTQRSILQYGTEGLLALHSLSKRSNLAGLRAGFYAGDADVVSYLALVRMHAGAMLPGPVQSAAAAALVDAEHASRQREVYRRRLSMIARILLATGADAPFPEGGIYVWARCPEGFDDAWSYAEHLARVGGVVVSPGEFYSSSSRNFVRVAAVQADERIELVASRLGVDLAA